MLPPYLELPVCLGYAQPIPGQPAEKIVIGKFLPSMITHYHEGFMPEVGMFIYISGNPLQIALTIDVYEAKIKAYWDLLAINANEKTEKQIIKQKLGIVN